VLRLPIDAGFHVRTFGRRCAMIASVLVSLGCVACSSGPSSSIAETALIDPPSPAPTDSPSPIPQGFIKHVVIIVQENRSFNNLFHGYPGAYTVNSGMIHTGKIVALKSTPLAENYDVSHSHDVWVKAYDGGRMDGFDLEGTGASSPLAPYAYVQQSDIEQYWTFAADYTLADQMYQSNTGPSYPAHQYLIAGQSENADENPSDADVWGCDSSPGTRVKVLDQTGREREGPFPCFDYQTLADEIDTAGLSWLQYAQSTTNFFNAYDAISHIRYGPDWPSHIISPSVQIVADVSAGLLANVTWVTPAFTDSDHPGNKSATGPAWVSSVVDAIGNSPFWGSTAIFVLWDDWGGMYDPMPPPKLDVMGLGFRVPLLVISPYARKGYISHFRHESGSILQFTEQALGLPSLGTADARADNLGDCFDFTQAPLPFVDVKPTLSHAQLTTLRTAPPENDY